MSVPDAGAVERVCPLCGTAGPAIRLLEAQGYPILQCGRCDLAFTGIALRNEQAHEFYRTTYYTAAHDYAASLKRAATVVGEDDRDRRRAICKYAGVARGRVLDVGCAAGGLLLAFLQAGWECCGVEPSAELAAVARENVGCEIHESPLETVSLPPETFDAITALHVLEHSPDPRSFLGSCYRLLKKGGVLLLEVPDFGSREARRQGAFWVPLYPDTHLYHFTLRTLSGLLESTGFRVRTFRRCGGLGVLAGAHCQDPAGRPTAGRPMGRLKAGIFASRHLLYRVPLFKRTVRYAYWHLLRMNNYLSVLATKPNQE